jgi:hypothetical protein
MQEELSSQSHVASEAEYGHDGADWGVEKWGWRLHRCMGYADNGVATGITRCGTSVVWN